MIEQTFQVGADAALDIRIASGKLELRSGAADVITVRAKGSGADHLTIEQRGSTVWVANERRSTWIDRSVYVTVEIPDGIDVDASVASADVECDPTLNRLSVNAASGDIRFGDAAEITIKTASGDVRGKAVSGRVNFVSASGDLILEEIGERSELSTASGDLRVGEARGSMITSTMSGDVYLKRFTGSDFSAKSMSGDVDLGVPAGTTVELDATTLSGDIRLPEPAGSEETSNATLDLRVRLVSGDLRIRRV